MCAGLPKAHTLAMARELHALLADSLATARGFGVRCALLMLGDGAYRDGDAPWACREHDPLGGRDADGFNQSCLRLLAEGFRAGYWGDAFPTAIAHYSEAALSHTTAQAWLGALIRGEAPALPGQAMPFQHPLEVVCGALLAASRALSLPLHSGDTWNLGAPAQGWLSARAALQILAKAAGLTSPAETPPQATAPRIPRLDSEKARRHLGWRTVYDAEDALRLLAAWHAHGADAAYTLQAENYLQDISKPQ